MRETPEIATITRTNPNDEPVQLGNMVSLAANAVQRGHGITFDAASPASLVVIHHDVELAASAGTFR